ncbi:MAG: response regulator, partial [Balneolales bacterium]
GKEQELQKMVTIKSHLFMNISHELRTPLTLIKSPVAYLLKKGDLDTESRSHLARIYRNTLRMRQLVDQIVDLNRIDSSTLTLGLREVNVNKFLRLICLSFSGFIESKKIAFHTEISDSPVYLVLDPDKIEKVLYNLLTNAVKFTDAGGCITVRMYRENEHIKILVKDSGIGMNKDQYERIFERYHSIGNEEQAYREGLGIGLTLSYEYMKLHHASIEVESRPGAGTMFTLTFREGRSHFGDVNILEEPYQTEDVFMPEPKPGTVEPHSNVNHQGHVLLVEDNIELATYIHGTLQNKGYRVSLASNGDEGLNKVKQEEPDIILSDVMMPVMDGYTMLTRLREQEKTRSIPVIFLTALSNSQDIIKSLRIGVNDYLVKPFDTDELEVRIHNLIELKALRSQTAKEMALDDTIPESIGYNEGFVTKVSNWLEVNMQKSYINVESLAEALNMSRRTLYREIKRNTGLSAAAFLKEVRLQFARGYVEKGKVTGLKELARVVGFSNVSYFRDLYVQRFGKEPYE